MPSTSRRGDSIDGARLGDLEGLTDSFFRGVIEVSQRIGCHPRDLLAVMMRESRISAPAHNRASNAAGLIQFLPGTLASLGWTGAIEGFRALSAEEQLPWVEKFLRPSSRYGLNTAARVYQAVFMPASLRLGAGDDTTLIDRRGVYADRYQRNRPLDIDGDGRITVGELQQAVAECRRSAAWQEIERRFRAVEASRGIAADVATVESRTAERRSAALDGPSASRESAVRRGGRTVASRTAPVSVAALLPEVRRAEIDLRTTCGLAAALDVLGCNAGSGHLASALRTFQRREGLTVSGIPDEKTRAAIAVELDAAGLTAAL